LREQRSRDAKGAAAEEKEKDQLFMHLCRAALQRLRSFTTEPFVLHKSIIRNYVGVMMENT
jgi:hypothetical protein